jgi:hypothetical protein
VPCAKIEPRLKRGRGLPWRPRPGGWESGAAAQAGIQLSLGSVVPGLNKRPRYSARGQVGDRPQKRRQSAPCVAPESIIAKGGGLGLPRRLSQNAGAILVNIGNPGTVRETREIRRAAQTAGLELAAAEIQRADDIAPAIEALKGQADALYVITDPLVNTNRMRINTFALTARLPTMYGAREYVEAGGGLISYGPNIPDLYRRAADYVHKILRGAKPADLPVEQPTKFDLVVNLTTARAIGLKIPESFLLRADEVIE